jgi:hypothetical protein|tara:strand:+ start:20004 stop:23339 length:3336 start_codon:yes stop_codon:yes gene_type:complete
MPARVPRNRANASDDSGFSAPTLRWRVEEPVRDVPFTTGEIGPEGEEELRVVINPQEGEEDTEGVVAGSDEVDDLLGPAEEEAVAEEAAPTGATEEAPTGATEEAPAEAQGGTQTTAADAVPDDLLVAPPSDDNIDDLLGDTSPAAPDETDLAAAAAKGALHSAVSFSGVIPGAMIGAGIGALTGPLAPIAVPVLSGLGMIGGFFAGNLAADALEEQGLAMALNDETPEGLRGAVSFGQVAGAGVTFGGTVMSLARLPGRLPPSWVGNLANRILDTAAQQPVRFGFVEASSVGSAAIAEGLFEQAVPGRPLQRTGVGMVAGGANVLRLSVALSRWSYGFVKTSLAFFRGSIQRSQAAAILARFANAAGEDPEVWARLLSDNKAIADTIEGFKGNAAMIVDSPGLRQLTAELMEGNREFYNQALRQATDNMEAVARAILLLRATGSREGLKAAAELRQNRYRAFFAIMLDKARQTATEAAERIIERVGSFKGASAMVGREATEIYERALGRARAVEAEMWRVAFKGGLKDRGIHSTIFRVEAMLQGELASADVLPKFIVKQMDNLRNAMEVLEVSARGGTALADGTEITKAMIKEANKRLSVGEMINFRSGLLTRARGQARSTDELADRNARQYGLLAEAVFDDLTTAGVTSGRAGGQPRNALGQFAQAIPDTPYDQARRFSAELADAFRRSFVGEASSRGAFGLRIPPEALLRTAMAGGKEKAFLRMQELREAVKLVPARDLADGATVQAMLDDIDLMYEAQARFLFIMADEVGISRVIQEGNVTRGAVKVEALKDFIARNEDMLEKFPEVDEMLTRAASSQKALDDMIARQVLDKKRLTGPETALGRLLRAENPADVVRGAVGSPRPLERLSELAGEARKGGDEAVEGLRHAIFDYLEDTATTKTGRVDLEALLQALDAPLDPGKPSLRQFMLDEDIIDLEGFNRIDEVIELASLAKQAITTVPTGATVGGRTSIVANFAAKAGGAAIGRLILGLFSPDSAKAAGPSLIMSATGAREFDRLLNKLPRLNVVKLLTNALRGDELKEGDGAFSLLDTLLAKAQDKKVRLLNALNLQAYLWAAGFTGVSDSIQGVGPVAPPEDPLSDILGPPR